jgi:hypothetical protein
LLSAPTELPRRGASVLVPEGVSGVVVPMNSLGPEVRFRWPFKAMVRSMFVHDRSGDVNLTANIAIQILDQNQKIITTDGQGQALFLNPTANQGIEPFSLNPGWSAGRPFALQRLVQSGDIWTFRIANQNTATDVTPEIIFFLAMVKK